MNRRRLLKNSAALGFAAALPNMATAKLFASSGAGQMESGKANLTATSNPLTPPALGSIRIAFPISEETQLIDFAGPWEIFDGVVKPGTTGEPAFEVYTVAGSLKPISASGMKIIPDYTFETAPAPKLIVIPAQGSATTSMLDWIRTSSKNTDVTMSVCTGAFVLARTGLLSGKSATTFHQAFDNFEKLFPDIKLIRGARFVEDGNVASSGGLTSGMDLAFRVVERYFGRELTEKLAFQLEYQGKGWMSADSNNVYAAFKNPMTVTTGPICPVCGMAAVLSVSSAYKGKTYYFCMQADKATFDRSPEEFVKPA
jgi:putative intracellular protease/amidase/YHS domain-containing protein